MNPFAYQLRAVRVAFGSGASRDAGAELTRAGLGRALILTTPGRADQRRQLEASLGDLSVGWFDRAQVHVPAATVADAKQDVQRLQPDSLLALGGGSAIGLGKALAIATGLPLVAVPTTYSGSEMTDIWGITSQDSKRTGRDPAAAPRIVIYDPELTLALPPHVSAASGMNAIAHAVEALYAFDANPIASMLAAEALRIFSRSLRRMIKSPRDAGTRSDLLLAAHFAGFALSQTSMGVHHKICHVLGGTFGLPHAETHAAVLPYVAAFNTAAAPDALRTVATAIGANDAAGGLHALNQELGLTATLADLGLREADLPRAAELASASTYANPAPVTCEGILGVLRRAWTGRP
jgi:maleylacetate reductase